MPARGCKEHGISAENRADSHSALDRECPSAPVRVSVLAVEHLDCKKPERPFRFVGFRRDVVAVVEVVETLGEDEREAGEVGGLFGAHHRVYDRRIELGRFAKMSAHTSSASSGSDLLEMPSRSAS